MTMETREARGRGQAVYRAYPGCGPTVAGSIRDYRSYDDDWAAERARQRAAERTADLWARLPAPLPRLSRMTPRTAALYARLPERKGR